MDPASLAAAMGALGSDIRCMRIANPLRSPLTLSRIILQIDAEQGATAEEEMANAVRLLATRISEERLVLLIIEQAETLDHEALSFLQRLPGLAPPDAPLLQILFIAGPRFWTLLQNAAFAPLRAELAGRIEPPPALAPTIPVLPIALAPHAQTRRRAAWGLVSALALAGMAGALLLAGSRATVAIDPEPAASNRAKAAPGPGPVPASMPPESSRADSPNTDAPLTVSAALPAEDLARSQDQLRRAFDGFLSMSGPKIARLTKIQREELFQQYLLSQSQSRPGTPAP